MSPANRSDPVARAADPTAVTVVVASHNRRDALLENLPRLLAPVILVDNGSDDGTPEAVGTAFPWVRVVRLPTNIGAAARTVGVRLAGTRYVAFADDDSYWEDGALARAAALLDDHPRVGLLAATVLVGPDGRLDPVSAAMAAAPLGRPDGLPGPAVTGFLACAAVVRRDAYLAAGGFHPALGTYGEEDLLAIDLALAGWGLAYVRSLRVRHLPSPAGRDHRARDRQQIRNQLLTAWLRRPYPVVLRNALRALRHADGRAGLWRAVRALPGVLRQRRVAPARVQAALAAAGD